MNEENYSLDVVSAFLAHLQMPLTSPHRSKLNVGAMVVLTGIPRIVETCPHSKVKATAQLLASRSRGIADFMSFLAVATDRSAMLDWTPELPNGQNGHLAVLLHNCAKTLVDLIKFDETVADAIVKQDSAHHLVLVWWLATCDGEIMLYPFIGRTSAPQDDSSDNIIYLFFVFARHVPARMARLILGGWALVTKSNPRLFVTRTIQRMKTLLRVNSLRHLSHLPDQTNELGNMVHITTAIGSLMSANNKLRDAILQEKLSAGFADVLYSVTFPSLKPAGVDAMPAIVVMLEQISEWSSNAPFPLAMRSMKGLITNGLVQIIGEYRKTRHLLADFDREKLDRTILFALSRAIEASMFPKTAFYFYKDALFHPDMKPSVIDSFEETVLGTAATFFEVYPLLLPQHRTHACDNLDVSWPLLCSAAHLSHRT